MKYPLLPFLLFYFATLNAQQVIRLYDGAAPGSESWNWEEKTSPPNIYGTRVVYNVSQPTLTAFLPDSAIATGTAIIIAPGGAFHTLSIDREGFDVAKWLAARGIAAFVLKYRVVKSQTDDPTTELLPKMRDSQSLDAENAPVVPLATQDGLAAVKYLRDHATALGIQPNQIGFMGFSAGGTLTMSVVYTATDDNRPNFVAPFYLYEPAILGSEVPKAQTPIFIAAASDDQLGFAPHSIHIYSKWLAAGQPAEIHIYEQGGHGFGMNEQKIPTDSWTGRFEDWMKTHGYTTQKAPFEFKDALETIKNQKQQINRMQMDWANFEKYKADNVKVYPPKPREHRVVFMGNSITEFWVYEDPTFFTQNPYIGRGISGQTTPQMVLRFRPDVIDLKPEVVVINGGINDIAENTGPYDPGVTLGNIISMAELAQANHIKVVLASIHPASAFPWRMELTGIPDKIIALNKQIKEYADKNGFVYLDYHSTMKNDRNGMSPDMAADGVHPTLAGYKVMEKLAQEAIKKAMR